MTEEQKAHSAHLAKAFSSAMERKYANGAAEHGGNLYDRSPLFLLDQAISEAIDLFVYLQTLRDKLEGEPFMQEGQPEDPIQPLHSFMKYPEELGIL